MLHHEILRAEGAAPTRSFLFLHGILGSGANWRSIARALIAREPSWQAVLVDLRGHGRSSMPPPPHTLAACASDVEALAGSLDRPARGVLGHSFGGKVAMALAARTSDISSALEHVVFVDSMPGARPNARGSENVLAVLDALESLPRRFARREDFIAAVLERGQSEAIASWLAMSLERDERGVSVRFELPAIRALLDDYFATDLWRLFEEAPVSATPRLHHIVGDRSSVFDEHDRERASALAREGRVALDVLPAGHWVHVDDPRGLLRVLGDRLRGTVAR